MDDWCAMLQNVDLAPHIAKYSVVLVDLTHGSCLKHFPCPTPLIGLNKAIRSMYLQLVGSVLSIIFQCPHHDSQMICDLVYKPTNTLHFPYKWKICFSLLGATSIIFPCTELWNNTIFEADAKQRRGTIFEDLIPILGAACDGSMSAYDMGHLIHFCGIADHVMDCNVLVQPIEEALRHMSTSSKLFKRSHLNAGARKLGLHNAPFVFLTV
jgi:hypothetical protein